MLSPTTAWTAAMQNGRPAVRQYVRITLGATSADVFHSIDGDAYIIDVSSRYYANLNSVSTITRELDILTRETSTSTVDIALARDGETERMVTDYALLNGFVEIYIGTRELGLSDYLKWYSGYVDSVKTSAEEIYLKVSDLSKKFLDRQGFFVTQPGHPIDIIDDVVSRFVDSSHLNLGDYSTFSDISHLVSSDLEWQRYTECKPQDSVTVREKIGSMLSQIDAGIATDESGQLVILRAPTSGAADDDWTDDDVGEIEVVAMHENIINRVEILTHRVTTAVGDHMSWNCDFIQEDTDSQSRFALWLAGVGSNDLGTSLTLHHPHIWGNGYIVAGEFTAADDPDVNETFNVTSGGIGLTSGCCNPSFPSVVWDAGRQIDGSNRYTYIRIQDEIIKIKAIELVEEYVGELHYFDAEEYSASGEQTYDTPVYAIFTVAERGALGTTAAAHNLAYPWYDVTSQVIQAQRLLDRFANGAFILRVTTGPEKGAVQLGDVVTLTTTRFIGFNRSSGLDTNVKLEVVMKDPRLSDENPHIEWLLAYAYETSPPAQTLSTSVLELDLAQSQSNRIANAFRDEDVCQAHIVTGLEPSDGGGFDVDISAGKQSGIVSDAEILTGPTYTLNANKDYYLYHDASMNMIVRKETALGAGEPTISPNETYLGKVVTDGVGISSVTDGRELLAIQGAKLKEGTGPLTNLSAAGVLDSLSHVTTRDLDLITDGATYTRVTGVSAGHQVQTASIATAAVTTTTVAQYAIGTYNTVADTVARNHGFDFNDWSRG